MSSQQQAKGHKVLLFGDQQDSWHSSLAEIYSEASHEPWLQSYLNDLGETIKCEVRTACIYPALHQSMGTCSLQDLAERYRQVSDDFGMAQCLLIHAVRSSWLLRLAKQQPHILYEQGRHEYLGIATGLLTMAPMAVATDFETLRREELEIARLLVRFCTLLITRSRNIEDRSGHWAWNISGLPDKDLIDILHRFQEAEGIPLLKRAKVGVTGSGWATVIGPPSVLEHFINNCSAVENVTKKPVDLHHLQHIADLKETDLDDIIGNQRELLDRPLSCPQPQLWGMDGPQATYQSYGQLLRAICYQICALPLNIPEVVAKLSSHFGKSRSIELIPLKSPGHILAVLETLRAPGRNVNVSEVADLLQASGDTENNTILPQLRTGRIAVVGMSGRAPRCDNVEEFWNKIMSRQDTCSEVPKDRFDTDNFPAHDQGDTEERCKTTTTKYGCFMNNPGHFDARFFDISSREASTMDPAHRHFLMSSHEALDLAGYSNGPSGTTDPSRIGVSCGQAAHDWCDCTHAVLKPGRNTSQSSSATHSIHLACLGLLSKDIDMAVVGAGNILSYHHSSAGPSESEGFQRTGYYKPFEDDANGYCRGEFVGSIVLKRLEDAVADNDTIHTVIASSGANHSGNFPSIIAPKQTAQADQEELFWTILHKAHVTPSEVSYVEMHGVGMPDGDPIELSAIDNVFKHRNPEHGALRLGTVKGNFGHSGGAAGLASLFKCVKMFQTDTIPPQIGTTRALKPNPLSLPNHRLEIPSEPLPYFKQCASANQPRRILLNDLDAAGGNACLLLEDWQDDKTAGSCLVDPRPAHIVTLSARTHSSHEANKQRMLAWLSDNPDTKLADVAYTTTARRTHHPIRSAYTASTVKELRSRIKASLKIESATPSPTPTQGSPVVFVFTGQGAHYAGIGAELYATSLSFRKTVDECARIGEAYGFPLFTSLITNMDAEISEESTPETQLAVLALEVSLAAFWESVGVKPSMVVGHSLGEYAALHVAGILSLADAIYLVGQRALLLVERCESKSFSMLAVAMSARGARKALEDNADLTSCIVACINGPNTTTISGMSGEIRKLQTRLSVASKDLAVPYGFHSVQMDLLITDYATLARGVTYLKPRVPVASTLLGEVIVDEGTFGCEYMARQTRDPVNFLSALEAIRDHFSADPVWIELGPRKICTMFVESFMASSVKSSSHYKKALATIEKPGAIWQSLCRCLALLYTEAGVDLDWLAFHKPFEADLRMVDLPTYAWDMKDYGIKYSESVIKNQSTAESAGNKHIIATFAQELVQQPTLSAGKTRVKFRALLTDPGLWNVIQGHRMEKLPICPGSAFCEAGLAAAAHVLRSLGREEATSVANFRVSDPVMHQPLTKNLVGDGGELLTTVTLDIKQNDEIGIIWEARGNSVPVVQLGTCRLTVIRDTASQQASWDRISHMIKSRMDHLMATDKDSTGHRFKHDLFYLLFSKAVDYDPLYKCTREAFVSLDFTEAVAEIVLQEDPPNTKFMVSPYWIEGLVHLAGFTVNSNPKNRPGTSYINAGFESYQQTEEFQVDMPYFTYVRVQETAKGTKTCQAYVLDSNDKLIAQCCDLKFMEVSSAVLGLKLSRGVVTTKQQEPQQPEKDSRKVSHPIKASPEEPVKVPTHGRGSSPEQTPLQTQVSSGSQIFQTLVNTIISETGIDASDLTSDTVVADLGVDSIMSIQIANKASEATDTEITPALLLEYPTVGDLERAYQDTTSEHLSAGNRDSMSRFTSPGLTPSQTSEDEPQLSDPNKEYRPSGRQIPLQYKQESMNLALTQSSSQPIVKMTLLHGRAPKKGRESCSPPPFYIIADGTGTIATYIHLPRHIKSKRAIYGIDSPYMNSPSHFLSDGGIPNAARLIADALLAKQPKGMPVWLGGYSGGAMIAYEVSRQLTAAGHEVQGLLLADMCAPRMELTEQQRLSGLDGDLGVAMFEAIASGEKSATSIWDPSDRTFQHLRNVFNSVASYHPNPPADVAHTPLANRIAIIWARRGMMGRCIHSASFKRLLEERGIGTTASPGFMKDPKFGAVAWSLIDKTEADLGPNGWERFVGSDSLIMSVDSDHLELPMASKAHLFAQAVDRALAYFET